jgi:hypothetical protein
MKPKSFLTCVGLPLAIGDTLSVLIEIYQGKK